MMLRSSGMFDPDRGGPLPRRSLTQAVLTFLVVLIGLAALAIFGSLGVLTLALVQTLKLLTGV